MLTQLKLTKVLIILSVFNLFGNIHTEANTLSRQAAVTQQKSKVTGIVEDENGKIYPDRCQKRLDTRILFRRFKNPGNNLERGKYTKRQNGQRHPGFG